MYERATVKTKTPSWQPNTAQAKSDSHLAPRPFPMPVQKKPQVQASQDLSGYRKPQNRDMIDNVRRYQQTATSTQPPESTQFKAEPLNSNPTTEPVQKQEAETPNQTGLPDNLKAGVENLSGYSLDDVRVHYNSPKPAQLQALAYTQGTDIHLAPGQEEHLPHEAWHVVQQMQGRVKPTMQMKGMQINDEEGLEREAEVMGGKAEIREHQLININYLTCHKQKRNDSIPNAIVQGVFENLSGIFENLTSWDIWSNIPVLSSLYGFLPGESHHKRIAKTVFNNLSVYPRDSNDWRMHQTNLEKKVKKATKGEGIDAKIRNDIYVASIMKNQEMLKTAINFGIQMSKLYQPNGTRSHQISGNSGDMDHIWPVQDLTGSRNSRYYGWLGVADSLMRHYTDPTGGSLKEFIGMDEEYLSRAVAENQRTLLELSKRQTPYTLEETMYVLRMMGQMRDLMKSEKAQGGIIPDFLNRQGDGKRKFNRIRVRGQSIGENRDIPQEHSASRSFLHRFFKPYGTFAHKDDEIYRVIDPMRDEPQRFDYLQGTSGTTLDMINFFLAHGKSVDEATKLMQVFYAILYKVIT